MGSLGCELSGVSGSTFAAALQFFAASQCLLQESWPPEASVNNETHFDFIVVGGGSAGSTLAARLSALPVRVLLLEAGGDPPDDSIVPYFKDALLRSEYDWNYTTTDDTRSSQALSGGSQRQPRGKVLGGCGSINDMIYSRGFPDDYEQWAGVAGQDWLWDNVLPYFKKTERLTDERITADPELASKHGFDGEIEVSGTIESTYATARFLTAFKEMGFGMVKDMTNPDKIGAGRFSHTIKDGRRHSSLTALLNKASERKNLQVVKNALVTKIIFENNTATGVKVLLDDEEFHFYADKEVIVSAGTFNSAKLLQLSGIGPKKHLEDIGISVVKDLPVGDNLQDHSMVLMYLAAENGTCESKDEVTYINSIKYLYDRSGSLTKTSEVGLYISYNKTHPNLPDYAIYPTCIHANANFYNACINILGFKEYICTKLHDINKESELITLAVVNLKPKSRGKVRLRSVDPQDPPFIYSGTFSDPSDLDNYADAMIASWSVAATSYFRSKKAVAVDLGIENCKGLSGKERLNCIAKDTAMSAWHAVGTAAMGSVVDGQLRVQGVGGLRVVDASVMPQVVRGNTNAPVIMIAEKAADYIKKSLGFLK